MAIDVKTVKISIEEAEIREYWTPERMKAATPMPFKPSETVRKAVKDADPNDKGGVDPSTRKPKSAPAGALGLSLEDDLRSEPVTNPLEYPWRCVGKLFFTMNGNNLTGSASAINQDILLTAAHCLYDVLQDLWAENVIFVPAYTNAEEPFGMWVFDSYTVPLTWVEGYGEAHDYGAIKLMKGGKEDKNIGDVVGYLGYITQLPFKQEWTAVGYPSNQSGGQIMIKDTGPFTRTLDNNTVVGKEDDMNEGSSGGPWLLDYEMSLRINGLVSFGDDNLPGEAFSPYFGEEVAEFLFDITN